MITPQRTRMQEILRRHVREEDVALTDHDFIMAIFERYAHARAQPLIDPNE